MLKLVRTITEIKIIDLDKFQLKIYFLRSNNILTNYKEKHEKITTKKKKITMKRKLKKNLK